MTAKKLKRVELAKERKANYESLTTTQKILSLDMKLGVGVGAVKQRAKLLSILELEKNPPKKEQENINSQDKKKPYQKPKRS